MGGMRLSDLSLMFVGPMNPSSELVWEETCLMDGYCGK